MFFLYSLSGKLENCRFIIRIKYPLLANYKLLRTKSKHLFRKDFIYLLTCNDTPTLKFNIIILYLLRLGGVFSWGGGGFSWGGGVQLGGRGVHKTNLPGLFLLIQISASDAARVPVIFQDGNDDNPNNSLLCTLLYFMTTSTPLALQWLTFLRKSVSKNKIFP